MNNINPIYLIEASFMSNGVKNPGIKLFKNGVSKNGFIEALKRNSKAASKRGEHKVKEVEKHLSNKPASSLVFDKDALKDIGKRARKGKNLSSKQIADIKRGWAN